jgi:hypothetical protein
MRPIATLLVCQVQASETVIVGACWDGGPTIGIHIEAGSRTVRATSWPIWNDEWDTPLISVSRESFERFVVGRLEEPGVVDELLGLAAA